MIEREYPYEVWVLQPSFKPKKVTIVGGTSSTIFGDWRVTDNERRYGAHAVYESKDDAIRAGWQKLHAQQAKVDKDLLNIEKRRAVLNKTSAERHIGAG